MKKKQKRYSKVTDTLEESKKARQKGTTSRLRKIKYKRADKLNSFSSENFAYQNSKIKTRTRKKVRTTKTGNKRHPGAFLMSHSGRKFQGPKFPKSTSRVDCDKTLKTPNYRRSSIVNHLKGAPPKHAPKPEPNAQKRARAADDMRTAEPKQSKARDKKKRTKCVRHNSEGNQNPRSKMNSLFKLRQCLRDKEAPSPDKGLITDIKILNQTSDYSIKNSGVFPENGSEVAAIFTLDSMSQSVSMVSRENLRKTKKFNENLLSVGSVLLNNLAQTVEGSRKDNNSLVTTKSKISLDVQVKTGMDVNFFSQVNNTIITEENHDLLSVARSFDEEGASANQECFLDKSGTHESLEVLSPDTPLSLDTPAFPLSSPKGPPRRSRLDTLRETLESLAIRRLRTPFNFVKAFWAYHGEVEKRKLAIDPRLESDGRTKLMIKNIPNKYNILQLAKLYNASFEDQFDFLYLVMDPKTNCNQGYAFINMTPGRAKYDFFARFNGSSWPNSRSGKKCEITYAKLQNKDPLDRIFLKKYYHECHKYWVPPKVILRRFPDFEFRLDSLEKRREMLLKNRLMPKLEYLPFYGNHFGPQHPHFPFMSYHVFAREQSLYCDPDKRV